MANNQNVAGVYCGTSQEEERQKYDEIKDVAVSKVESTKASVANLAGELHELQEVYDVNEKEGLAQWFIKDNRFKEVRQDLLRAERAVRKPYFGRIDFIDPEVNKKATYYIGKSVIYEDPAEPMVIDWRSPVSSVYYEQNLGRCRYLVPGEGAQEIELERKRTYELDDDGVKDFYDSEVVANDELLTKYLSKSSKNVLSEIIATIQQEQNEVIRINPHRNVLIQGSAGSGKTTVAMHRISYILYNYALEFAPADFYIVGSNKMLLNYITGVLPDLDVYDIGQMTMEELFIRLLYEEWKPGTKVKHFDKTDISVGIKGTGEWFEQLSKYCERYLLRLDLVKDIIIEENGHVIMSAKEIADVIENMRGRTIYDIYDRLSDILVSRLENELFGKGLSYPQEMQKKLYARFGKYFKKFCFKESVWDIYEEFISEASKGRQISYYKDEPDLYDLAAMAYIYKALKETEVIREACHVVIDEAQDFGMAVYCSLKYCLSKCTFTIMGDVSQNINFGCGLGDWEELKKVMLPDRYDYFGLLRKSYRNTIEISNFAHNILKHGTFPIYPVEPIIRHGNEVSISECGNKRELADKIFEQCIRWNGEYDTIAVICKDVEESKEAWKLLREAAGDRDKLCTGPEKGIEADSGSIPEIRLFDEENVNMEHGVTVLPIEYSKGLEFDAVIIYDASSRAYPKEDGYAKLLYVAATRALHELAVFYRKELTALIKDPIPKDRENVSFTEDDYHLKARAKAQDTRTRDEIARDQAKIGDSEMALRDKYGPRRSVANSSSSAIVRVKASAKNTGPARSVSEIVSENSRRVSAAREKSAMKKMLTELGRDDSPKAKVINANGLQNRNEQKLNSDLTLCSNVTGSEFGESPTGTSLQPLGHGKLDIAVRWIDADKSRVKIISSYGTLLLKPIAKDCVRVSFSRNDIQDRNDIPYEITTEDNLKWKCEQTREEVNIILEKLKIVVNKKSGIIRFMSTNSGELLAESEKTARQYSETGHIWWNYFAFGKKEIIKACDTEGNWIDIDNTALYVSNGEKTTVIMSMKGYRIIIPGGTKVLLNTIPSYSTYIRYEQADIIDYFFQTAK